jgi:hypothetical protein
MKFSAHFGNFIVQILRLSLTADIDLLDETIRNCKLCNTINLREAEVCPSKKYHTNGINKAYLFFFNMLRPILIVSEHTPLIYIHAKISIS